MKELTFIKNFALIFFVSLPKIKQIKNIIMKNSKQIIIDAPEGKVIDMEHFNQTGNVRFIDEQPAKIEFPKEWSLQNKEYHYITSASDINYCNSGDYSVLETLKNSLPSKSLAKQMLIFTQLITMRERYREIEKLNNPELGEIDWSSDKNKYCVVIINNKLGTDYYYAISRPFSFQLPSTRDEFAKNFGDMILQCKDILG